MQRRLAALRGLGRLILRRPFPPMPDQPLQSSPGVALLQGPLGVRCHGSILRTVAEHLGPAQRLLEGLLHAMLHPYSQNIRTCLPTRCYAPTIARTWACLLLHSYPYSASL